MELLFEDYLKRKKEEEEMKKKQQEELIRQQEELIRQKEEERLNFNDNVNYLNDFQCENIDNMKDINYISNSKFNLNRKSVAVYSIIRNNERLYELACSKRGEIYYQNYNNTNTYKYNIVIYDILLNKITNKIYGAHSYNDYINNIKHYYYSSSKKHFLLSSSQQYIKLWNISSKIITKEIEININNNNYDKFCCYCSCLLFNNENYYIFGGGSSNSDKKESPKIFNKDGNIKIIGKSNLEYVYYIEATYIKNKPYILLSGNYHSE